MQAVYIWGHVGRMEAPLATDTPIDKEGVIPYPSKMAGTEGAIAISVSQTVGAFVNAHGIAFSFGSARHGRLGQGPPTSSAKSKATPSPYGRIIVPAGIFVQSVAIGDEHGLLLTREGLVFAWGNGASGALGDGISTPHDLHTPKLVEGYSSEPVVKIAVGNLNSAVITSQGALYVWGSNEHGKLGVGADKGWRVAVPTRLDIRNKTESTKVRDVDLGSLYSGCITAEGQLFMWGFNGAGNLGVGDRKDRDTPTLIESLFSTRILSVSCTKNQVAITTPVTPAQEAPHTVILAEDGSLYTCGTSHKGLLGNVLDKALHPKGCPDELTPFRIGSSYRDHPELQPTDFREGAKVVAVKSAHIHNTILLDNGRAYSWGCGSQGRCGVTKYMEGLHGARSRMKCYLPQPIPVHTLKAVRFTHLDTSRAISMAIGFEE